MADKIIQAGNTIQLLISQKGVQAMITLMTLATVLFMTANGIDLPEWLKYMASLFVGLYFDVPGKVTRSNQLHDNK